MSTSSAAYEEHLSDSFEPPPTTTGGTAVGARRPDTMADRALAVLGAFGTRTVLGVSEVGAQAGLPKSTAHRLLTVLADTGYVSRVGDRYCLSARMFELGNLVKACRPNGLRDQAVPFMSDLFARTGETIHLAVPDGLDILYVEKIFGHKSTKLATWVGARRPAYVTALGKVLLAYRDGDRLREDLAQTTYKRYTPFTITSAQRMENTLQQVQQDGWAVDFEESFVGVSCLAVPVLHPRTNEPVAALSITTSAVGKSVMRFQKPMLDTARQLSARIGPLLV
ncbi:IclR family transcriptional regulator [Amycolatopsis sp. GM8]|uniref:IclR family transcriptional regulator n=1 Tax=Amycolatopsis sp. GM8 TaxID=2896530 RepID=UPI001F31FC05|nr:IclR family transcriptional regulator [Amycolatopsis sp. GM8]